MKFQLVHPEARRRAVAAVADAPENYVISIKPPGRTLDQNAAMWPILQAFADQLEWPVNGRMTRLSPDEWKDILTAAFRRESARLAQGLDGGVVMLGARTSRMDKATFSAWLEFLHSVAVDRGVDVYAEVE